MDVGRFLVVEDDPYVARERTGVPQRITPDSGAGGIDDGEGVSAAALESTRAATDEMLFSVFMVASGWIATRMNSEASSGRIPAVTSRALGASLTSGRPASPAFARLLLLRRL